MNENSLVGPKPVINVPVTERTLSGVAGYLLLMNALNGKYYRFHSALAGGFLLYRAFTGHCPAYKALGKKQLPDPVHNVNIRTSVLVNKPRSEVYNFWRNIENLPLFMSHLESVIDEGNGVSAWKAKIPANLGTIDWKARIVKDEDAYLLAWNSLPGAAVENAGKVTFIERGLNLTELEVVITYRAPLGVVGEGIATFLNPLFEVIVKQDIQDFKKFIESVV